MYNIKTLNFNLNSVALGITYSSLCLYKDYLWRIISSENVEVRLVDNRISEKFREIVTTYQPDVSRYFVTCYNSVKPKTEQKKLKNLNIFQKENLHSTVL